MAKIQELNTYIVLFSNDRVLLLKRPNGLWEFPGGAVEWGESPETCVAQIKALQQEGIAYFGCNFAFGGMAHHKVMRSMQLFAEAVMPHFRP